MNEMIGVAGSRSVTGAACGALLVASCFLSGSPAHAGSGRTFLYKEVVLSGFYSPGGMRNVPPGDASEDSFELSPRPPGSYAGVDFIRTFDTSGSGLMPLDAINLHPRILFDRMENTDGNLGRVKFAPQDFWARFRPADGDRLTLRVGQFVIPYGVNPVLAPRQRFILPLEAADLGLKWDWGVNLKGPAGEYDWELAATIGSGEALHDPHLFDGSDSTSFLVTGRVGTPTYWDFQYGVSLLAGDLPMIRAATKMNDIAVSRWRVSLDSFWKHGTFLMTGAQLTYGQDGLGDDARFMMATGGKTADVLGTRAFADWVVPWYLDLRLAGQFESVVRDVGSDVEDTAFIFEAAYSTTTAVTLMLDYRMEIDRSMGDPSDALYLTFTYYSL